MNVFANITEGTYKQINDEFISQYDLVISTDIFNRELIENWNKICRSNGVAFIATGCIGFYCFMFTDLIRVKIYDRMFQNKVSHFYIHSITNANPGVVT